MEIISHRGYWLKSSEKNKRISFNRSFKLGIGTETDLRDYNGKILISHDIPTGDEITFDEMLEIYRDLKCRGTLALNIKSDGLQELIKESLNKYEIENYFLFDASVPDTLVSIKNDLNIFARYSEFEPKSDMWELCDGLWYDSFSPKPINYKILIDAASNSKRVSIVSEELHGRTVIQQWSEIKAFLKDNDPLSEKLILCTDIPEKAQEFFNG